MARPARDAGLRRAIVETARRMAAAGLVRGRAGNVSARTAAGLLITPSGLTPAGMRPSDIVPMGLDGSWEGALKPSSEWRFHCAILARWPEAGAVVHAHPPFATALACLRRPIPAFHYMVAKAGGPSIRCAGYATFGTAALADRVVAALEGRRACLLANHGMVAIGADLEGAFELAVEVEELAEQYCRALQIGRPRLLSAAEMRRVATRFAGYGRPPTHR